MSEVGTLGGIRAIRGIRRLGRRLRRGRGKGRPQRSLFGEILDWMLAPLLLLWPLSVILTWLVAQGIANRPFDRQLAARADALARDPAVIGMPARPAPAALHLAPVTAELLQTGDGGPPAFQVRGPKGEWRAGDPGLPAPPDDELPQAGEARLRDGRLADAPVRVAYRWVQPADPTSTGGGPALVQVAERFDARRRLATEIVQGVLLPQFVVLPLAVLLIWLALARGIAPLSDLQQRIHRRDSDDLSPIDEQVAPEEVAPLVHAINDLLHRLDQSMRSQKHFLADAAHQLKTPLAGLRTQAEYAERQIDAGRHDPQALKKTLQQIARSSQNAAHMVNQLLAMARAENQEQLARRTPVGLAALAIEAVRDFVPRALEKRIDLGYEGPDDAGADAAGGARVLGQPLLLRELIRNLVDNALHYTPPGGTVTVRVAEDSANRSVLLQVEDSGPGIPPGERERVFEPFYRSLGTGVDGSGLGLAIVREIARQHGAQVAIEDAWHAPGTPPNGALLVVRLPAAPTPDPQAAGSRSDGG